MRKAADPTPAGRRAAPLGAHLVAVGRLRLQDLGLGLGTEVDGGGLVGVAGVGVEPERVGAASQARKLTPTLPLPRVTVRLSRALLFLLAGLLAAGSSSPASRSSTVWLRRRADLERQRGTGSTPPGVEAREVALVLHLEAVRLGRRLRRAAVSGTA